MKVFYDKDCDLKLIKGKKVAIIGYGSQGHAHAQNLNDSGCKVTVGVRKGGPSWDKVKKAGLKVAEIADAVKGADFVMMLMPDEHIGDAYREQIAPNIKKGATLAFAHGFNIHYGQVIPREDIDLCRRRWRADAGRHPPGPFRSGARSRPVVCLRHRRRACRHHRDQLP